MKSSLYKLQCYREELPDELTTLDILRAVRDGIDESMRYGNECQLCGHHYNHAITGFGDGGFEKKYGECPYTLLCELIERFEAEPSDTGQCATCRWLHEIGPGAWECNLFTLSGGSGIVRNDVVCRRWEAEARQCATCRVDVTVCAVAPDPSGRTCPEYKGRE